MQKYLLRIPSPLQVGVCVSVAVGSGQYKKIKINLRSEKKTTVCLNTYSNNNYTF